MPNVACNGIRVEYERSGPAGGEPLLLIHGVGAQLIRWSPVLIAGFEAAGFDVTRFDNRDVGLSTHLAHLGVPDIVEVIAAKNRGDTPGLPYTIADMADDAAALLDALGVGTAHIVGVSLGGMIAQMLAIRHRDRVRSVAIIMSHSGNPATIESDPAALAALATPAPDPAVDLDAYLRHSIQLNRLLGSPAYPVAEADIRAFAALAAARAYYPAGAARQFAAGRGSPDRRAALASLDLPTLVIHGAGDPLIHPKAGAEIAATVPKAWHLSIQGMGHDLPDALADLFATTIAANARRAQP